MSVNFPTNRPEADLGSGALQQGDSWIYNSIEYTWVVTPDGTGIWSSKGININPDLYIAKNENFTGDIDGRFNQAGGLNVTNAETADLADNATNASRADVAETAEQTQGTLTLRYFDADGNLTQNVDWDGSTSPTFTFRDTDDATVVGPSYTFSNGVTESGGAVSADGSTARLGTGGSTNYVTSSNRTTKLRSGYADEAGKTTGTLTINGTTFNGSSNKTVNISTGGGGDTGVTQDLQSVLTTGNDASGGNATINLSASGNQAILDGVAGRIELTRGTGSFIDLKRNSGSAYECRVNQSDLNLILESRLGGVYVNDSENGVFRLTPSSGGGTTGDIINVLDMSSSAFSVTNSFYNNQLISGFAAQLQRAFNAASGARAAIYLPPGDQNLNFNVEMPDDNGAAQFAFFGDAFGTSGINLNGNTIRFANGANVSNIFFDCTGSDVGLMFKRTRADDEDMDSIIYNCDINCNNANSNAVAVQYWGRNLKFFDNRLKTGKNTRAGLQLLYRHQNQDGTGDDISTVEGFRRIAITNNTFHSFENTPAVMLGGDITYVATQDANSLRTPSLDADLKGLVFVGNTLDFEGTLFASSPTNTYDMESATFTGNSCYWGNCGIISGQEQYIYIHSGTGICITGNAFNGRSRAGSGRPDEAVTIRSGSSNVVTNNTEINFP